jgi:hypothetical protein
MIQRVHMWRAVLVRESLFKTVQFTELLDTFSGGTSFLSRWLRRMA